MSEEDFSEQDGLAIIRSMVNKARNQFSENGHLYLLWGWVILVCSLGQFVMQQVLQIRQFYYIWLLLIPTIIYQFIYLKREEKRSTVRTYTDEIIGYVWIAFITCTMLLVWLVGRHLPTPDYITVIWLIMYGMPTFLSGAVLRYRPLMIGGVMCWVLAIASAFVPVQYHMLLLAAAVVCGWILPGYGIQQKFKKQNQIAAYDRL